MAFSLLVAISTANIFGLVSIGRLHAAASDVWRGCCALARLLATELAAAAPAPTEISRQAAEEAVAVAPCWRGLLSCHVSIDRAPQSDVTIATHRRVAFIGTQSIWMICAAIWCAFVLYPYRVLDVGPGVWRRLFILYLLTHVRMVGARTLKGAACSAGRKQLSSLRTAAHSEQALRANGRAAGVSRSTDRDATPPCWTLRRSPLRRSGPQPAASTPLCLQPASAQLQPHFQKVPHCLAQLVVPYWPGLLSCHVPIGRAVQSAVRQSVMHRGLAFIGTRSTLKICVAMRCAFVLYPYRVLDFGPGVWRWLFI